MAKGKYSPSNNYIKLYATAVKYQNLPQNTSEQIELIKRFYKTVNKGSTPVEKMQEKAIYEMANRLHKKSIDVYTTLEKHLNEAEKFVFSGLRNGIQAKELSERVCIMLEGCSSEELRDDVKKTVNIFFPVKK